jgi:V/A-type H+/Na+-transporting ATPase subunit D
MARISPTRMNLLLKKGQIKIAVEGVKLLKSKRDALIKEFFSVMDTVILSRDELSNVCQEAMNILNLAKALEGEVSLESVALGTTRNLELAIKDKHVWGIPIPEIEDRELVRAFNARGYNPATVSTRVDETAEAFEKILNQALKIASQETRLKRLGEEIRKTSRRVNALEQILIPILRSEVTFILRTLEERSREDTFRLKRLKGKKAHQDL